MRTYSIWIITIQTEQGSSKFFAWLYWRRRQWQPIPVVLPGKSHEQRSLVGCSPWGRQEVDMTERLHFHFPALEKEMATHSSVPAWRIPGTGEPGWLLSMGSHRVGHDWSDLAALTASASRKYTAVWVVIHQVQCGFWTQAPEGIYNRRVRIFILIVNQAQWPPYLGP